MNPDDAFQSLQKQAFILKFVEIGKILFTTTVLQSTPQHQVDKVIMPLSQMWLGYIVFCLFSGQSVRLLFWFMVFLKTISSYDLGNTTKI